MRKLNAAVDRFAYSHPNFGIPNLMKFIVIGNVIVYLLAVFAGYQSISFLGFSWEAVKHFEVWRLVTFLFMPGYYSAGDILWLAIFLYLYYMIGNTLEREWGTAKFTLYYLCGVILTLLTGIITGLVTGQDVWIAGADYVNLSMFFAFAMLYPDTQFLVMFIIPVKVKWLALLDGVVFAVVVIQNLIQLNFLGALLPVMALLNFFVFFWTNISDEISYRRGRARHQTSHQTIHFKSAVRKQRKKEAEQGYRHKCEVCGRTDTDYPDLEEVDVKLLKLAKLRDGCVLTTDYNLNKVAGVSGIQVLNINDLANALKPVALPGEEMEVLIVKEGKEQNQGVGYLDDGTMIVVEGGKQAIGQTVTVSVTSVLQTSAGRMIFAKMQE